MQYVTLNKTNYQNLLEEILVLKQTHVPSSVHLETCFIIVILYL